MADESRNMTDNKNKGSAQKLAPPVARLFDDVFDDFCVGLADLQQLRTVIAERLVAKPHSADAILVTLDSAFRAGLIKSSTYESLTTDVDRATSEDEPTEWSVETQKQEQAEGSTADANFDELTTDDTGYPAEPPGSAIQSSPPEAVPLAPGAILKNRFELVAKIGAGSMADVYEAIDRRKQEAGSADPRVAIKVISRAFSAHPNALKTLQRETLNSQALIHRNIIRVFDSDWDDERFFMTMELLDGRSLVAVLDERRLQPLLFDQAQSIITAMCDGLRYAHQQGVIHADIKPGNIFVAAAGPTKILDFGIARMTGEDRDSPVTGAHTPAYSSCEVLEGAEPTPQDDIFAMGCVAYRMLAGSRAFGGLTALDAERKRVKPQRIESLNAQQWRVLEQSLVFRRADRLANLDAFAAAFTDSAAVSPAADRLQDRPHDEASDPAIPGLPLRFGIPAIAVLLIAITLALFWPDVERTAQRMTRTESLAPDTASLPATNAIKSTAVVGPPTPVVAPVVEETPPEPQTVVTSESKIVAADPQPVTPAVEPEPEPVPEQNRFDELVTLADGAMNDGRLVDPADDNARMYVLELAVLQPEAPEVQPHRTRLAELMFLEAMIAIADEDFDAATRWIAQTDALGVPEEMTQRIETKLQQARAARSVRQTESLGAIFASVTPAAILADPANTFDAMATQPAIASDEPVTSPGSLSLALTLPGALASVATEPVAEEPAGELAQVTNPDIPLSALEFTRFVEAKFPRRLATRRGVSGWVEIKFRINTNGRTDDVRVLDAAPDDRFNKAAITAVSKWRFKPVTIDGVATEKYSGIRIRFEIE